MKDIITKHVDACVAEIRAAVEAEFHKALSSVVAKPAAKPVARRSPRAKKVAPTAAKPAPKPAAKPAVKSGRTCGCGPVGRHRRECKAATTKPTRKAASDAEESPRADREADRLVAPPGGADRDHPPNRSRGSRAVTPTEELPVIPHAQLIARLAADRDVLGDAGGLVLRGATSLVGHAETKRELCVVHGWVGRVAFERDHLHCVEPRFSDAEPCQKCRGTGLNAAGFCKRCGGTGYKPDEVEDSTPLEPDKIQAGKRVDITVDGERVRLTRDARGHERAETTAAKQLTRQILREGWDEIAALDAAEPGFVEPPRPRTRAECGEQRPCPWVGCRYHLALDVSDTGSIKLVFPDLEPWELTHSCSLDAAELGAHTLDALAEKLNVTRERVRQLEVKSLYALRAAAVTARVVPRSEIAEDEAA